MSEEAAIVATADAIAGWLKGQLAGSGAERFVLGLSGGIDSAVVCGLCVRAVGSDHVLGAIMPSQSNPLDAEHAALVAATFGVHTETVDLTNPVQALSAALPAPESGGDTGRARLAVANLKPRLRMATLYYLATLHRAVVVGTGNRSEAMIGYFTKYGDGGVDLLPIVDLYKHEVRALARVLGVPAPIITKAPSAGLWHGQTDESEIGMSYDDLDRTLAALERGNTTNLDDAKTQRVINLLRGSEHKRRPVPAFRRAEQVDTGTQA